MIPAYNKKRCAAFPFETGIHFRRKTDFLPEDTTMSYSGFEPEPSRLLAEGHIHHTGWETEYEDKLTDDEKAQIEKLQNFIEWPTLNKVEHAWKSWSSDDT
ncbi:hypothetical protein TNCV_3187221 [Trichonephila clavipes]|nr:hypothetical protein TNCV_3187221 [Trichonephila clavipes]